MYGNLLELNELKIKKKENGMKEEKYKKYILVKMTGGKKIIKSLFN